MTDDFTQSFDGMVWAEAFVERARLNPAIATDAGTMVGWFANALMRGWDEHARRYPPDELAARVHALIAQWREDLTGVNDHIAPGDAHVYFRGFRDGTLKRVEQLEAALAPNPEEKEAPKMTTIHLPWVYLSLGSIVDGARPIYFKPRDVRRAVQVGLVTDLTRLIVEDLTGADVLSDACQRYNEAMNAEYLAALAAALAPEIQEKP